MSVGAKGAALKIWLCLQGVMVLQAPQLILEVVAGAQGRRRIRIVIVGECLGIVESMYNLGLDVAIYSGRGGRRVGVHVEIEARRLDCEI